MTTEELTPLEQAGIELAVLGRFDFATTVLAPYANDSQEIGAEVFADFIKSAYNSLDDPENISEMVWLTIGMGVTLGARAERIRQRRDGDWCEEVVG